MALTLSCITDRSMKLRRAPGTSAQRPHQFLADTGERRRGSIARHHSEGTVSARMPGAWSTPVTDPMTLLLYSPPRNRSARGCLRWSWNGAADLDHVATGVDAVDRLGILDRPSRRTVNRRGRPPARAGVGLTAYTYGGIQKQLLRRQRQRHVGRAGSAISRRPGVSSRMPSPVPAGQVKYGRTAADPSRNRPRRLFRLF